MNPAIDATASSLVGMRVLDLSRVLAGPWCTQVLGDLGADVVKVERPGVGDDTRGWGPPLLRDAVGADSAESAYFLGANRNKRSITIDLAHGEGQALVRVLAQHADVLVENFKVGDMARYGLDHASLAVLNPQLVYCSITGYGQTGPYRERACRLRLRGAGARRSDERDRRARRSARRRAPEGRCCGGRPVRGALRHPGHPGGAAPSRRAWLSARPRPVSRHVADRHAGGDACQSGRQLPRQRRRAGSRRQRAPDDTCRIRCSRWPTGK